MRFTEEQEETQKGMNPRFMILDMLLQEDRERAFIAASGI